jgi:hypothetical protein
MYVVDRDKFSCGWGLTGFRVEVRLNLLPAVGAFDRAVVLEFWWKSVVRGIGFQDVGEALVCVLKRCDGMQFRGMRFTIET